MGEKKIETVEPSRPPRVCNSCGIEKPYDSFPVNNIRSRKTGELVAYHSGKCRTCKYLTSKRSGSYQRNAAKPKNIERKKELDKERMRRPEVKERRNFLNRQKWRADIASNRKKKRDYVAMYYANADNKRRRTEYRTMAREMLFDSYVLTQITNRSYLSACDVPPELVELKRLHIQIKRELKRREAHA